MMPSGSIANQNILPGQDVASGQAPMVRELPADLETPISVYLKLAGSGPSFLLESVTGGEQVARYSFIGVQPTLAYILQQGRLRTIGLNGDSFQENQPVPAGQNPLQFFRQVLAAQHSLPTPNLPRLTGGLVGYLGYEMMRYFEPSVSLSPPPELPDALFLQADVIVAFDHAFGKVILIGNPNPRLSEHEINDRFDEIQCRLADPLPVQVPVSSLKFSAEHANMSKAEYTAAVRRAKQHITAGDIFQVVLSQRLSYTSKATPFDIYRSLRRLNPSPYMFFFNFAQLAGLSPMFLLGASPEMHVRLEGRRASLRPIAGTRPRGNSFNEDQLLEQELLADPKERAEHVMLVDLARNDLGRICNYGSVRVVEQMAVERYSHVMHIVSQVEGELCPGLDAFDLLTATFPAGTVSGAPKIRATQIIDELEHDSRGPYAGAVGYCSYDGSLDTCIAIRTLLMQGNTLHMQAGAGIVADSDPEAEYHETLNKLRALATAVKMAEVQQ